MGPEHVCVCVCVYQKLVMSLKGNTYRKNMPSGRAFIVKRHMDIQKRYYNQFYLHKNVLFNNIRKTMFIDKKVNKS